MTETSTASSIRRVLSMPFRRPSRPRAAEPEAETASATSADAPPTIDALDQTWDDWIERYQTGSANLSNVARPLCFSGYGHMSPPDCACEAERLQAVARLVDRRAIAREKPWLDLLLRPIIAQYRLSGASVSILDASCQLVCFQIGLGSGIKIISRKLSIDGHALLSKEHFALLDASSDWRTQFNPLVHGPPFIKFYIGVPLLSRPQGLPVGVLAVFDPYIRSQVPRGLVQALQLAAERIIEHIELPGEPPRIDWPASEAGSSFGDTESQATDTPLTVDGDSGVPGFCLTHAKPGLAAYFQPLGGQVVLQPFQVVESLLKCRSFRHAFTKACYITAKTLGLEVVYVVEVRVTERYAVVGDASSVACSGSAPMSAEFEALEKRVLRKNVQIRRLGSNGDTHKLEMNRKLHIAALDSEFGLRYSAGDFAAGSSDFASGLLIPFRKTPSYYTCKRVSASLTPSPCSESSGSFSFEDELVATVRWGGFVMCGYSSDACSYSPGDVAFMKKVVKALESILICKQEQELAEQDSPASLTV